MDVRDLVVEVRDRNLQRVGQITPERLNFQATLRDLEPGEWSLPLPVEDPMVVHLRAPGAGVIVSHRDPAVGTLLSGPVNPDTQEASAADPTGTHTFKGDTDDVLLWNRAAYPTPTRGGMDNQGGWWTLRDHAETVMLALVAANLGPDAPVERSVEFLDVAPSLQRGHIVSVSARFDPIGELLAPLARGAALGFRMIQVGTRLRFEVTTPQDRRDLVRLDLRNGTLSSYAVETVAPGLTFAIVAGQGQGAARTLVSRTTQAALDAERDRGPWARKEAFIDRRDTDELPALEQAGDEALAEAAGGVSVKAVPGDDQSMAWPTKWAVGDTIGVNTPARQSWARVTSVTLIAGPEGVKVGAGIGDVAGWTPTAALERRQRDLEERLARLERHT